MGTRILFATLALSVAIVAWTVSSGRLSAADGASPAANTPPAARAGEGDSQRPADGQVDERVKRVLSASAKFVNAVHSIEFRAESTGMLVLPGGAEGTCEIQLSISP